MKKTNKRKRNNPLKIIIPVMLAGLIIFGIFVIMNELTKQSNNASNGNEQNAVSIKEDPVKSQDPSDTTTTDDKNASGGSDKPEAPTTNPDTGLKNATVDITYAGAENGQVGASGEVANIVETSGTCTYTFTHITTNKTITLTSKPIQNSSNTVCASVSSPQANFSAGTWSVVLKYKSNTSEGESTSVKFEIN